MFGNPKHPPRRLAIAAAVGLACCGVALAAKPVKPVTPAYTIVPFVSPFPGPEGYNCVDSQVMDLNNCGQAVGFERFEKQDDRFQTVHQALHLDIDITDNTYTYTLLPDGCLASGVNNLNQIAGSRFLSDGRYMGMFLKAPVGAAAVDLPPLIELGHTQSVGHAINDDRVIVGCSSIPDGSSVSAALWIVQVVGDAVSVHGPWPLLPLEGDARGAAYDVNKLEGGLCQVTGISYGAEDEYYEAVVWTVAVDGTTATPGPAVSLVDNNAYSVGSAINDSGDVCGLAGGGGRAMPFLAPAGQTAQPLPVPQHTHSGDALDVNNLGEVVGYLTILVNGHYPRDCAYLWKDGSNFDLNKLIDGDSGWAQLWGASVINDAGIIAGYGSFDIDYRGFLLIPNP